MNFGREPHAQPDVRRYDGLVVLGGPMNVDQCGPASAPALRDGGDSRSHGRAGEPMLGICLGAQLLAAAMGGDVHPNPVPEIGWYRLHTLQAAHDDRLFRHFERRPQYVFQWHAYTFAPPPGAVPLAWTRNCRNQAYRLGERAWGLQFHLEADAALIERWLGQPKAAARSSGTGARRIAHIRAGTRSAPAGRTAAERSRVRRVRQAVRRARALVVLPSR